MGTWGSGIFEDDAALDQLALVIKYCIAKIRTCFDEHKEPDTLIRRGHAEVLANVDIICTLCRQYGTFPNLEVSEVETWQKKYLEAYDTLLPVSEDTIERDKRHISIHRAIIVATFYQLLRLVDELWGED